jgi:N-methylhydantoinase B/oxoprolinase/acetone carboxylase alpha subunit
MNGQRVIAVTIGQGTEEGEEPHGLFGGNPGTLNSVVYHRAEGQTVTPLVHDIQFELDRCTVEQVAGGGGGYGSPYERDPALVLEEVRDELLSFEKARRDYGVIIDEHTMTVDRDRTTTTREKRPG